MSMAVHRSLLGGALKWETIFQDPKESDTLAGGRGVRVDSWVLGQITVILRVSQNYA